MLVVSHGKNAVRIGRVISDGNRRHAVECLGAASVDSSDARMRIGRMQNLANQHAGQANVIGIFARPSGLARRVDHGGGLADD